MFTPFTGSPNAWPKIPIIVEGDTIVFHFTSNPFNTFWGYRCIITGLCLESSMVPLWDLQKTIAYLVGRSLRTLVSGQKVTSLERLYAKWLNSPLLLGGLEDETPETSSGKGKEKVGQANRGTTFLTELIEAQPESGGKALFDEKYFKVKDLFDTFGGEVLNEAIRWFVGVALKHLNLVDVAMSSKEERQAADEQKLDQVFREAKELRKWVVSEHQRIANELSEKKKEKQEKAEREAREAAERAAALSSSGGDDEGSSASSSASSSNSEKKPIEPETPEIDISSYEYLSECFVNRMKTLFKVVPAASSPSSELLQLLVSYAKVNSNASPLEALRRRGETARGRIQALGVFKDLLGSIKMLSVKQDVLRVLGPALRSLRSITPTDTTTKATATKNGATGGSHYLTNTESSGPTLQAQLRESFHSLYTYLMGLLKEAATNPTLLRLIVDAWSLDFRGEDHPFLHQMKVLETLHEMIDISHEMEPEEKASKGGKGKEKEKETLAGLIVRQTKRRQRLLGRFAYTFLVTRCIGNDDIQSDGDHLRSYILESVTADLEQSIALLLTQRRQLGHKPDRPDKDDSEDSDILAYHKNVRLCVSRMSLFNTIAQAKDSREFICSQRAIRLLIFIHYSGKGYPYFAYLCSTNDCNRDSAASTISVALVAYSIAFDRTKEIRFARFLGPGRSDR